MVKQTLSVLRFTYQYYIYSDLTNKKKFGAWSPHTFFCIIVGDFKKTKNRWKNRFRLRYASYNYILFLRNIIFTAASFVSFSLLSIFYKNNSPFFTLFFIISGTVCHYDLPFSISYFLSVTVFQTYQVSRILWKTHAFWRQLLSPPRM